MRKMVALRLALPSLVVLLTSGTLARADSLRDELLSKYPLLNSSDIAPFLSDYEAKCKAIDEEASQKIAALPKVEWTDEDAELFWSRVAETADRTSTVPRWKNADAQSGEGLLEAFGTRYMPNAYATYQETRAVAKEREQLLAENFPNGRASDATGGTLYDKVSQGCVKAVAEMLRRHDELCHFYLLHRAGAVTDGALAELDREKLKVVLPEIGEAPAKYSRTIEGPSTQERDFAQKYLPETWAGYQRLETTFADGVKNYAEWRRDAILVDAVRSETLLQPVRNTLDGIGDLMGGIVQFVKEQKLLHAVGETTAAQLTEEDKRRAKADTFWGFEKTDSLSARVKSAVETTERHLKDERLVEKQRNHDGRVGTIRFGAARDKAAARQKVFDACNQIFKGKVEEAARVERERKRVAQEKAAREIIGQMVPIPDKNYCMGKYEVTQSQWEAIMGKNPCRYHINPNNPVCNVSWDDCQRFLEKLNEFPDVKKSGLVFRLPKYEEWKFACLSGSNGKYCKLVNGTEITQATLGHVAWFEDNSNNKPHPVGQKRANAFGLYDMHGNVKEFCQDKIGAVFGQYSGTVVGSQRVCPGGCYCGNVVDCLVHGDDEKGWVSCGRGILMSNRSESATYGSDFVGFRLCVSGSKEQLNAIRNSLESREPHRPESVQNNPAETGQDVGTDITLEGQARTSQDIQTEQILNLLASMVPIPGKNYRIGKYEVTQGQWKAVMGSNPSNFKGTDNPVENVSWNDCQVFLKRLNALPSVQASGLVFRLPTDAEWEYACRAGATGKFCKLADGTEITEDTLNLVAWYEDNSDKTTHSVGQKEPNAFGCYDMHGNVWEWCQEEYGEGRVRRGGSWGASAWNCESSRRGRYSPVTRYYFLGFRLCADGGAE